MAAPDAAQSSFRDFRWANPVSAQVIAKAPVAGKNRAYHGESAPSIAPSRGVSASLARSTPWRVAGSGDRDVALARGKASRAAWRLNLEKGDASFMAAARLALGRRRGVRG
jgi:hypothetical protein